MPYIQLLKRECLFCKRKIREIDYKDVDLLLRFISKSAKILPSRRTGTCQKHQRKLKEAIERARYLALLPYVAK